MRHHKLPNALTAAALLLTPFAVRAQTSACGPLTGPLKGPLAAITVGSTCQDISAFIRPVAGTTGQFQIVAPQAFNVGGNSILFTPGATQFKSDPFINFGFTSTGPGTFVFSFYTPITPGQYTTATSSAGVSITDLSGGVTNVTQNGSTPYLQVFGSNGMALTDLGVDLSGGACATSGAATRQCPYGPQSRSFPPTFYDNLETTLTYTVTGAGAVSWSGGASIAAVPEPSTWALVGTGVAALAGVTRRRRRTAA